MSVAEEEAMIVPGHADRGALPRGMDGDDEGGVTYSAAGE